MKQKSIINNLTPFCRYVREGTLLGRKASPPESWAGHYGWNFKILSTKYEGFLPCKLTENLLKLLQNKKEQMFLEMPFLNSNQLPAAKKKTHQN